MLLVSGALLAFCFPAVAVLVCCFAVIDGGSGDSVLCLSAGWLLSVFSSITTLAVFSV